MPGCNVLSNASSICSTRALNQLHNLDLAEARRRVLSGDPAAVRAIDGSFALVDDRRASPSGWRARWIGRCATSWPSGTRGRRCFVADRIDTLQRALEDAGLDGQFHPSYTRMVPAHYIVELALVGCPDPDPTYTRFFTPARGTLPAGSRRDRPALHRRAGRRDREVADRRSIGSGRAEPIGVSFSGGIDSGSVFLVTYHTMLRLGMAPARLKAFVLDLGERARRRAGARVSRTPSGCRCSSRRSTGAPTISSVEQTLRVLEDYKSLDVECAAMGLLLCQGIRERYPDWRHLADGDGGDENLKDYPIEENPELTIRSVVDNLMLYQEGWGVGRIKHSLTYSGGLSRSYVRTYAPARQVRLRRLQPLHAAGRHRGRRSAFRSPS